MTDRRTFVALVAGACLLEPLAICAQQTGKIYSIGLLLPGTEPTPAAEIDLEALHTGLRDLGWVDGKNLMIETRCIDVTLDVDLDEAITRAKGGGLVVVGDPMLARHHRHIIELALRSHVPSVFGGRRFLAAGGLMSYLSPRAWHWRSAARFVDKILKGAKPADISVEQPTKFELVINLNTAKALGITIPQSLLQRADEVIQ